MVYLKCDCGHDIEKDHGVTENNRLLRCMVKGCRCQSPGKTEVMDLHFGETK